MDNQDSAPLGTIARPYQLHWSADQYRGDHGIFDSAFDDADVERARRGNRRLGVRQYRPSGDNRADLDIPPGSYVECYLIRDGIHDQSYHNMKNLGKSTSKQGHRLSTAARAGIGTVVRFETGERSSDRATTVKEVHNLRTETV